MVLSVLWALGVVLKATADPPSRSSDREFWLSSALLEVPLLYLTGWVVAWVVRGLTKRAA